ncbi:phenylacetate-CoA oxygenase subunit PaaJ [Halomonas sp. FeN2]|jgi:ring-1,2-phenylacetyl-CoA epoxidase subunit PaaD|uniref:1,2-phenylacetyl-CoA epoxidase subunit PaaD n=1 Tax=Vreelandella neptunia TaxID=115551 RepID=A0ABZ0YKA3_9GAMM|nr:MULTISPECIES: 1,2-phenylacetyl-CoA epoxidase subunit PaaD [Halomonas]MDN3562207.1 1,2-phenylacetyl-CoA epoxidase subunit PaaD [Halomonas neptunia]TDV96976.1 ring-1,2-phenylacetyl-CoA epoxidase subunit PaaD [Halomonas alkaliantarctica]UBR51666.1 phenylacetate-CoA oxygenase subunit PaaJ [Halomonas sp. FeN2]WQH12323.1 1,2-phenylacetyl-CoA epoxidase subunit PaaD [Halomonas neptunia]|tara:strand:+ start:2387 stop:2986 length:600 start_codon:yes stop_codon:yes gene_type:complete
MQPSGNHPSASSDDKLIDDWPSSDLIGSDRSGLPPAGDEGDVNAVLAVLQEVPDPEVPVVSVVELGIVRDIDWLDGRLAVSVTPTYSGCPATEVIEQHIHEALVAAGYSDPLIQRRLSPAWTTDWLSEAGREKLRAYGIAPPVESASKRSLTGQPDPVVPCPLCGSNATERVSEFGSTACKALYRCRDCLEPFDYFKCL